MSKNRCVAAIGSAILLAVGGFAGSTARAELVAGWDFSQYIGDGNLVIDDGSLFEFVDTLSANYSSLDPTSNAGAESAAFGTMYIDGQFGSTAVPAGSGSEQFLPTASIAGGSLVSNLDAPVFAPGDNAFDAHQILQGEGQANAQFLSMTALDNADVVFAADRGTPPPGGNHWFLSFGARTQSGASTVGVEFSPSGSGYGSVGSANLTTTDTRYEFDLGPATGATAFVRLRFQPTGPDAPVIDNVAISVPEPAAAAQVVAIAVGLLACRRRRG